MHSGVFKAIVCFVVCQPFCRHWAVSLCAPLEKLGMHKSVSGICREACIC